MDIDQINDYGDVEGVFRYQMGVKNFKHKGIPRLVPLFKMIQNQEFNQTMMIQVSLRVNGIFLNLARHLLQTYKKIEREIKKFMIDKMQQKMDMTSFKYAELTFTSDQMDDDSQRINVLWLNPVAMKTFETYDMPL